jgi:hypothetical protein
MRANVTPVLGVASPYYVNLKHLLYGKIKRFMQADSSGICSTEHLVYDRPEWRSYAQKAWAKYDHT